MTLDDVDKNATTIYGPDLSFLKGKSTRKRPKSIENIQITDIPPIIKQHPHTKIVIFSGLHDSAKYCYAYSNRQQ